MIELGIALDRGPVPRSQRPMADYSSRYKGRSTPVTPPVAFRAFGEVRPLLNRYVLAVYGNSETPPREIVCDSMEAALALNERLTEADLAEFERSAK